MIRWGIIGAGNIAHRFTRSLMQAPDCKLVAISGRNREKIQKFADAYGVEKVYVGHENLLNDEEIDAVYIALPQSMHMEWSIKALEKKKAVLCEKPSCLNANELFKIKEAARTNDTLWMEAMKTRFVPLFSKVSKMVESGRIGDIVEINSVLSDQFDLDNINNTYHKNPKEGGVLLDCACYCATWYNYFLKETPEVLSVESKYLDCGSLFYVDAKLNCGTLKSSFLGKIGKYITIVGTKGSITLEDHHRPTKAVIKDENGEEVIEMPYVVDDFYGQITHFNELLRNGVKESPIVSFEDSYRNCLLLDRIWEKS